MQEKFSKIYKLIEFFCVNITNCVQHVFFTNSPSSNHIIRVSVHVYPYMYKRFESQSILLTF